MSTYLDELKEIESEMADEFGGGARTMSLRSERLERARTQKSEHGTDSERVHALELERDALQRRAEDAEIALARAEAPASVGCSRPPWAWAVVAASVRQVVAVEAAASKRSNGMPQGSEVPRRRR